MLKKLRTITPYATIIIIATLAITTGAGTAGSNGFSADTLLTLTGFTILTIGGLWLLNTITQKAPFLKNFPSLNYGPDIIATLAALFLFGAMIQFSGMVAVATTLTPIGAGLALFAGTKLATLGRKPRKKCRGTKKSVTQTMLPLISLTGVAAGFAILLIYRHLLLAVSATTIVFMFASAIATLMLTTTITTKPFKKHAPAWLTHIKLFTIYAVIPISLTVVNVLYTATTGGML